MCEYCNDNSSACEYFIDPLDHKWYQRVFIYEWNAYDDDWEYDRNYGVSYCQYCGRKLGE